MFLDRFEGGERYIMDKAKWHSEWINKNRNKVLICPTQSPEFNKPVEHLLDRSEQEFKRDYVN